MVVAAAPLLGGLAGMQGGMMLAGGLGITGAGASFLGAAGYMAGSFYGGQIFSPKSNVDMPRVSSYPIQESVQGNPIPIYYGCCRGSDNVIWLGPTQTVAIKHSAGGKGGGGGSTTEIRYKKSFLLAVAEGPATIGRIWSGKTLVTAGDVTVFDGPGANAGLSALVGEDFTDYPNLCCAWFQDWDLGNTEQIPNFVFEVNSNISEYPILQPLDEDEKPTVPANPADTALSSPTSITNRAGLEAISGANDYTIDADISLSGSAWTPLTGFTGVIEGNGYTISDMTIASPASNDQGFFADIGDDCEIRNLNFENCEVIGDARVGILVGQITNGNDIKLKNIRIKNCSVTGDRSTGLMVGGFDSDGNNRIFDCTGSGQAIGESFVGGLIGEYGLNSGVLPADTDQIVRCDSEPVWTPPSASPSPSISASVSSSPSASASPSATPSPSVSPSPSPSPTPSASPSASASPSVSISPSISPSPSPSATISPSPSPTASISPSPSPSASISPSASASPSASISASPSVSVPGVSGDDSVGGLIGYIYNSSVSANDTQITVHSCNSSMPVTTTGTGSNASDVGGLFGAMLGVAVTTCYATGDVSVATGDDWINSMGGFGGSMFGLSTLINCWSTGDVDGFGDCRVMGGFIGKNDMIFSKYLRCWSTGDLYAQNDDGFGAAQAADSLGGFLGYAPGDETQPDVERLGTTGLGEIQRCYSHGNVTIKYGATLSNEAGVAGFIGHLYEGPPKIENCYAWGGVILEDKTLPASADAYGVGGLFGDVGTIGSFIKADVLPINCYQAKGAIAKGADRGVYDGRGGICGTDKNGSFDVLYTNCYFDLQTAGLTSDDAIDITSTRLSGARYTRAMRHQSNYVDWNIGNVEAQDTGTIWYMPPIVCGDENPSYIIRDLLTHPRYGVGLDEDTWIDTDSFDELYTYFADNNLLISLPINDTRPVYDWLEFICSHVAAYVYVTNGKVGLGAWRDQVGTFAITTDHLVVDDGEDAPPPVQVGKRHYSKTRNRIEVAWTDRANDYNTSVAPANDFTDQRVSKKVRKGSVVGMPGIMNNTLAVKTAHRILLDSMYRFSTYTFTVSMNMQLIETGDVGTINDGDKVIDRKVRVTAIRESANGVLRHIECVDDTGELYPLINYSSQSSERVPEVSPTLVDAAGVAFREDPIQAVLNLSITPGNANVNGYDVYRSYDDTTYEFIGRSLVGGVTSGNSNSRGTTTTAIPAVRQSMWDADQTLTVSIGTVTDLSTAITDDDFFGNRKLAKIDDEIIAYHTCVETAVEGVWTITGVIRGLYWTEPVAHAIGATFETLDNDFRYILRPEDVGETLYFKVAPIYGRFTRDFSEVAAVSYDVQGEYLKPAPAALLSIVDREGYESITAYPVDIDIKLASKISGWGMGGFGEVPFGNFSPDERLKSVLVALNQTDGTEITTSQYDLQGYMHEGDWRLNIADADRDGNDPIDVSIKAVGDKTSGARVHRVDIA